MRIRLVVPDVKALPADRPRACRHCGGSILQRHGTITKPIRDHKLGRVVAVRYKCADCNRTFRHYPPGVTAKDQSLRTVVLAALMYGLGLSCSAASHLLRALGADVGKTTVWRDAQEAGEALRRGRPKGEVRAIGADETAFKVEGREVAVGFVTDAESGRTLGFEVLWEGDGEAFVEWLRPYVEELGVEVLVSDDNDSYNQPARDLGLDHQVCVAHVRKYVARRSESILEQAKEGWGEGERLDKLRGHLLRVRELVDGLEQTGGSQMGEIHLQYVWAERPGRGERACAGYRMRMLTVELWDNWEKLRLYLRRPELGLDGTDNCTERCIGKSKIRYKTMRGHKSLGGMANAIALTQWLYSGDEQHDLAKAMAA